MWRFNTIVYYSNKGYFDEISKFISNFNFTDIHFVTALCSKSHNSLARSIVINGKRYHKFVIDFGKRETFFSHVRQDDFLNFNETCLLLNNVCHFLKNHALVIGDDRSFMGVYKDGDVYVVAYNHEAYEEKES